MVYGNASLAAASSTSDSVAPRPAAPGQAFRHHSRQRPFGSVGQDRMAEGEQRDPVIPCDVRGRGDPQLFRRPVPIAKRGRQGAPAGAGTSESRSLLAAERPVVPLNVWRVCLLVHECRGLGERRAAGPGREVAIEPALLDAPLRPPRQQP